VSETTQRCDLHLHTRYSAWKHLRVLRARDSYSDPAEVFERALAAGMDYVAITDHESIEGALRLLEARPDAAGRLIVGEEVETRFPATGQWVHVNVFGLDEQAHREVQRLRPDVHELVGYLRSRGLLHVLNHPFLSFRFQGPLQAYVEEILTLFDHFEAGNSTLAPAHVVATEAMLAYARSHGLRKAAVGGSDAHVPDHAGSSFTEAPGTTPLAWLASVARGDCSYRTRPIGFPSLLSHVYRAIGRYYAEMFLPSGRAGMSPVNYVAAAALLPVAALGVPAVLTSLNEARQRVVAGLARRALERSLAAPAEVGALDAAESSRSAL